MLSYLGWGEKILEDLISHPFNAKLTAQGRCSGNTCHQKTEKDKSGEQSIFV